MALACGVNATYITLEVIAGSVTLHFVITLPTPPEGDTLGVARAQANAVTNAIEGSLPNAAAASAFMGVTVVAPPTVEVDFIPHNIVPKPEVGGSNDTGWIVAVVMSCCFVVSFVVFKVLNDRKRYPLMLEQDMHEVGLITYNGERTSGAITSHASNQVKCAQYI